MINSSCNCCWQNMWCSPAVWFACAVTHQTDFPTDSELGSYWSLLALECAVRPSLETLNIHDWYTITHPLACFSSRLWLLVVSGVQEQFACVTFTLKSLCRRKCLIMFLGLRGWRPAHTHSLTPKCLSWQSWYNDKQTMVYVSPNMLHITVGYQSHLGYRNI